MLSILPTAGSRRRALRAAACALTTMLAPLATTAPAGAVGTYAVQACMDQALEYDYPVSDGFGGWAPRVSIADSSHKTQNDCSGSLGLFMQLKGTDRKAAGDYAGWRWSSPSGTVITGAVITYDAYTRPSNGQTQGLFGIRVDAPSSMLEASHGQGILSDRVVTFDNLQAHWLSAMVYCEAVLGIYDCPSGEDATAMVHRSVITVSDGSSPTVIHSDGSALDNGQWVGAQDLSVTASDLGSGIADFRTYVDGAMVFEDMPDDNGGLCVPDSVVGGVPMYHAPKPCPGSVTAYESIDTTTIPDGSHQVDLVVADAGGRETAIWSGLKVVANHPPVNDGAPAFTDAVAAAQPQVGRVLEASRGAWSGPDLTYAIAWERCAADGSACGQIPGATVESYMPTTADVGKRLRMAVTATNPADSVTSRTALTAAVAAPAGSTGGGAGGTGTGTTGGSTDGGAAPTLSSGGSGGSALTGPVPAEPDHVLVGHIAGEPPAATCPQDRAALVLQGIAGRTLRLRHGRRGAATVALTCAATGKPIAGAKLDVATRTGRGRAVASQLTTDAEGRATLRLAPGPSRAATIGYRMYADEPLARATVVLRVQVAGRLAIRASRRRLRNGQAVVLSGALAGGHVPRRGVDLAVQWRDGRRWRPFAQVRTDRRGRFRYAYRFTRTRGTVRYALRVQVLKGQVDYPFAPVASKRVRVTVRG